MKLNKLRIKSYKPGKIKKLEWTL